MAIFLLVATRYLPVARADDNLATRIGFSRLFDPVAAV
jgi:hypothetical protein